MKIKILASGSKGNCTYVECGDIKFLIDIGISFLQLKNELSNIGVDFNELKFVLITHTHNDHIKGLSSLLTKTKISLYSANDIYKELSKIMEINNYCILGEDNSYMSIQIQPIKLSHDTICYGFLIEHEQSELVYITDTGYLNKKYFSKLSNKTVYIIESNHDEKMLMDGPYPFVLKQRIISDNGHLSNITTGKILAKLIGKKTKYIFLAHISEHNNDKVLALKQVKTQLFDTGFNLNNILVAEQYVSLDMIEV